MRLDKIAIRRVSSGGDDHRVKGFSNQNTIGGGVAGASLSVVVEEIADEDVGESSTGAQEHMNRHRLREHPRRGACGLVHRIAFQYPRTGCRVPSLTGNRGQAAAMHRQDRPAGGDTGNQHLAATAESSEIVEDDSPQRQNRPGAGDGRMGHHGNSQRSVAQQKARSIGVVGASKTPPAAAACPIQSASSFPPIGL